MLYSKLSGWLMISTNLCYECSVKSLSISSYNADYRAASTKLQKKKKTTDKYGFDVFHHAKVYFTKMKCWQRNMFDEEINF